MPILSSTLVKAGDGLVACYTCPENKIATVNVNACNVSGSETSVNIAVTNGEAPLSQHMLEYLMPLPGEGGAMERTVLPLAAGQKVFAQTSAGNVAVTIYGFEESF